MDAYLAGFLFGDGCLHRLSNGAYAVWVDQSAKNSEYIERIIGYMKVYGRVYRYEYVDRHHNVRKIRTLVYSKILFQELDQIKKDPLNYMEKLDDEDFLRFVFRTSRLGWNYN